MQGDIFVIPPYIPHRLIYKDACDFEIIELEFEPAFLLDQALSADISDFQSLFNFAYIEPFLVSEGEVKPRLNLSGKNQILVEQLLGELMEEYAQKETNHILVIKALLLHLLAVLGRCFSQTDPAKSEEKLLFKRHQDALDKAIAYIDQHYADNITMNQVAKEALLSPSYFSYLFKSLTGKTFVEYLTTIRIQKSFDLLKNPKLLIMEVCLEVGFKNINHFNRTFKSITGMTPSQYRKLFGAH